MGTYLVSFGFFMAKSFDFNSLRPMERQDQPGSIGAPAVWSTCRLDDVGGMTLDQGIRWNGAGGDVLPSVYALDDDNPAGWTTQ